MAFALRAQYSKNGPLVFISHLDNLRLFQRAARRAELPLFFTKGFNPHPRISITPALKLGLASDSLEAIFYFDSKIAPAKFKDAMNSQLPHGIEIKNAVE